MSKKIINELRRIKEEHGGLLRPEDVVAEAEDKSSPLHNSFVWDDGEAARKYRLWQARQLISVQVEYTQDKEKKPYNVFVSLKSDRKRDAGYRELVEVVRNQSQKEQLLNDCYEDMLIFQKKYYAIQEVSGVLREMSKALSKKGFVKKRKTFKRVVSESDYNRILRARRQQYA